MNYFYSKQIIKNDPSSITNTLNYSSHIKKNLQINFWTMIKYTNIGTLAIFGNSLVGWWTYL